MPAPGELMAKEEATMNRPAKTGHAILNTRASVSRALGMGTLLILATPFFTRGQDPVPMAPSAAAAPSSIPWLSDYEGARKASAERGLPLLIEIGAENCPWCRQMDAVTLADPKVVARLNSGWICLKVDGQKNPRLVEAFGLRNYPTHVYADPSGKILGSNEGFIDPKGFLTALEKAALGPEAPAWLAGALEEARKARTNQDRDRASVLLRLITESEFRGPVYSQARALQQELEAETIARGGPLGANDPGRKRPGRADSLPDSTTEGTPARDLAKGTLASRSSDPAGKPGMESAAKLLADQMEEEKRQGHLAGLLETSERLLAQFPESDEAKMAKEEVQSIRNDPDKLRLVAEQSADKLAGLYLNLADAWIGKGNPQQGVFYLEKVLVTFPGSRHADTAQARLAQIKGPPPLGGTAR